MSTDPYDYAASLIGSDTRDEIKAFWQRFTALSPAIEAKFSGSDGGKTDIKAIMAPLKTTAPHLKWNFQRTKGGYSLIITAGMRSEYRPLARLFKTLAPALKGWEMLDAYPPIDPCKLQGKLKSRFGLSVTLTEVIPTTAYHGGIDQHGFGVRTDADLKREMLAVSTLLLGEEKERNWVVYFNATSTESEKPLSDKPASSLDPVDWVTTFEALIELAQKEMPLLPRAKIDWNKQDGYLDSVFDFPTNHPRRDLQTFQSVIGTYAEAVLYSPNYFSSPRYSRFNEWFMYLKIQRSPAAPFGHAEERAEVEDRLHATLSSAGVGGWVAAGHGTDHVYIDFAVTDVAQAVILLQNHFGKEAYAANASLHFLDQGLSGVTIPLAPSI